MKLNINPKELLALYNALYERFDGRHTAYDECKAEDSGSPPSDDAHLRQVYNRLRAILVAGLTNPGKAVDPVDSWLKHEQDKIDRLNDQNASLKAEARELGKDNPVEPGNILTDDEGEVPSDLAYPSRRKGPPPPNMPHSGKHRGHRK